MSNHLVYIHYGITPEYLYDTLEIARSYNKDLPITLITDDITCIDKLNLININYEYIDFFNSEDYKKFCNIYIHRCDWDTEKIAYKYETFNFFRFIILYNFTKKYNIEYVVYCDSDLAILHNLKDKGSYLDLIKNNDLVLLFSHSTFFSCWTFKTLENFIKYMYSLYNNEDDLNIVVENIHEIVRDKYHFSDMWLLKSFIYINNITINNNFYENYEKIKLKNIQLVNLNIFFIGNIYKIWSKGILLKNNKYSDTFRTLIYTYNNHFNLLLDDNTLNKLSFNNDNIYMNNEIKLIKDCFKKEKQKIIHFQGQSKNLINIFKNELIL